MEKKCPGITVTCCFFPDNLNGLELVTKSPELFVERTSIENTLNIIFCSGSMDRTSFASQVSLQSQNPFLSLCLSQFFFEPQSRLVTIFSENSKLQMNENSS